MDHVYCTVLSSLRLYQAIALVRSMHETIGDFLLYTLCVDDKAYDLLKEMDLKGVETIHIDDLRNPRVLKLKSTRSLNEYCWTLKPILLEHLFAVYPDVIRVTYVDADLFFWSDPSVIYAAQPENPVLLSECELRMPFFPRSVVARMQEMMGKYNSGFISFKNDQLAHACLDWWKNRCLISCCSKAQAGQFGDQKYLDELPTLFSGACGITTPGVNIGHWNNAGIHFYLRGKQLYADHYPLICYHFSGFRMIDKNSIVYIYELNKTDLPFFYGFYSGLLKESVEAVSKVNPGFNGFATVNDLS